METTISISVGPGERGMQISRACLESMRLRFKGLKGLRVSGLRFSV